MTKRKLRFVRYVDDFNIYTKSRTQALMVEKGVFNFLKTKLKLPINKEKSGIRKPVQFELLGFGFVPTYKKGDKGIYQLRTPSVSGGAVYSITHWLFPFSLVFIVGKDILFSNFL
ncbi:MAG: hypothetical protein MUP24_12145 [Gillisia sp.]|nr:hypothetical protein [Gillisia sp.]